jgi:DNA-directed RNA polymerase subunit M/transcription elongation factor TFIIS
MKDSTKLLGFNLNRRLLFSEFRGVDFSSQRDLLFDLNRDLLFDSDRDLPFGEKGVDFRHFICGGCGTVVNGEAVSCPKCKAHFKSDEESIYSDTIVSRSEDVAHSKMKEYFGKEYTEQHTSHPHKPSKYRCRSCGSNIRYIQSRGKWYCDRCRIYIGVSRKGAPKKVPRYRQSAGVGTSGVKFAQDRNARKRYPSEVVVVEDLKRRRRR